MCHVSSYQDDLVTPGISPLKASSRKQSRHISNFWYTARGLPQSRQRVRFRTLYFGVLKDFAIVDVFAT